MPITVPRILIFDDREEDGIKIAKGLWKSGFSARFIIWDESIPSTEAEGNVGVRIVFMDVDLLGDGIPSPEKAFNVILTALNHFLGKNNGPYVMITWSTYSIHAEDLFSYLRDRMPRIGLAPPIDMKILNKEDFEGESTGKLSDVLRQMLSDLKAVGCLTKWEGDIQKAGSVTIQNLLDIALRMGGETLDASLAKALFAIAEAEGGRALKAENASFHLNTGLTNILFDRACQLHEDDPSCGELILAGDAQGTWPAGWHTEINTLFHLDFIKSNALPAPGDVFLCPEGDLGFMQKMEPAKCIRANFIIRRPGFKLSGEERAILDQKSKLLLVEISPPCDHAQNKNLLNSFIICAQIPSELKHFSYVIDLELGSRLTGKIPDYFWRTPEFTIDGARYFLLFNSRLVFSLEKSRVTEKLGERIFRIRPQLMSDMVGWLSRQSSRLGHVELSG